MKKNYQIELCKKCWEINYSNDTVICVYFDKIFCPEPYTKETADINNPKTAKRKAMKAMIDYNNNTCDSFKSIKSMEGIRLGWRQHARDIERSNHRWLNSGHYYGQS